MSGPLKMYALRQIVRHDAPIELPTCMYTLTNIHATRVSTNSNTPAEQHNLNITDQVKQFLKNNSGVSGMAELQHKQEQILAQLEDLKKQMLAIREDLKISTPAPKASTPTFQSLPEVILNVSPQSPPYSLAILQRLWGDCVELKVTTHLHSSVAVLPAEAVRFVEQLNGFKSKGLGGRVQLRLIWKNVGSNRLELVIENKRILGECNFLRYLARALSILNYDETNYEIDAILDASFGIANAATKTERAPLLQVVNKKLGKSPFLFGNEPNIADVALFAALKQITAGEINANLAKWMQKCERL